VTGGRSSLRAAPLTPPVADHGEGPVAIGDTVVWLDMLRGDVLATDVSSGKSRRHPVHPEVVSLVRPMVDGGLLVATDRSVWAHPEGFDGDAVHLATLPVPPAARLNDGSCDTRGNLWIGSMAEDHTPGAGELFRVDASGGVDVMLDGLTISNGLAFSADGTSAFFVDSPTRRVDRLELDGSGSIVRRSPWARVDRWDGVPDGLTLDADGGVWVAVHGAGRVVRFDADGEWDVEVHVPVPNPTACAFVGTSSRLVITTSCRDLPPGGGEVAGSGSLFTVDVAHRGCPVLPFRRT
jgi:sugar lactone lactonase YvrE